ncbi:META domain-containing protein [Chitinophaga pendula]|uniref:META domain-containing protein n=1 Tax=Chitinophaga TaxID=79328 RepID=UPI000BAEC6F2|nr:MULTISPECIES: META domain-containing protein [Chitinophaga]ASZ13208.1 hypothetical protein CK934_20710 [Chitinophaga sp. MD30]UCJ09171.1 META domain-containing protein [Chitinophaga pendula]
MKKILFAAIVVVIAATACNSARRMVAGEESYIYNKEWKLTTLNGNAIDTIQHRSIPTLVFDKKNQRVSGNAGCNRMMGSFEISGMDNIAFSKLVSTLMACADMELEGNYMKTLEQVNKFSVTTTDNTLLLLKGDVVVARFIAK